MRRGVVILLGMLAGVAAAGCGSSGSTSAETKEQTQPQTPAQTQTHLFSPVGLNGVASGVQIAKTEHGECWTGSGADQRSDAWRCIVGNEILDPCFSDTGGSSKFVLCAQDPWSSVVKLTLTKPLPQDMANESSADPTAKSPWAIELADGKQCAALTGATSVIAGLRINYGCGGGGVLVGEPNRGTPTWTIFYGSSYNAKTSEARPISDAWW